MYSILIIDDEPIVKIALRSILPWEEPDIIITDLKMPVMD